QSVTDSFAIHSLDGTASETVTITITGKNEDTVPSFLRADYAAGAGPQWFSMGDLNGDGSLDLAVPDVSGSTLAVLIGDSDGTFGAPTLYPTGLTPHQTAIADLNNDADLDIVVGLGSSVGVMLGNGDGTFQPLLNHPVTAGGIVTVADLNND